MMMMMMMKFLVLSLVVISVDAGKDLMMRACHNADNPMICLQCLESNPASVQADSIGIAGIVIHCLESNLQILTKNITSHLPFEKDLSIKMTLTNCERDLSTDAIRRVQDAETALKSGDYDKAGHSVGEALTYLVYCKSNLKSVKAGFLQYYTQINICGDLSTAAMRIMDRF